MKKHFILFILFWSISFIGKAQKSENLIKNNVGLGLLYNDRTKSKIDFKYERFLRTSHLVSLSMHTNFTDAVGFKAGYKFMIFSKTKFQLLSGVDYHFESYKLTFQHNQTFKAINLELPLDFRFKFGNNLKIYLGIAAGFTLNKKEDENIFINNIKIGLLKSV
jgi:hypothetical protein